MLTTALIKAQVTPMVLGDSHAMLKMEQGKKYVLLPVQESEDIASIAVLNNQNDMVQRLNVKLAIDRVDYYVPYGSPTPSTPPTVSASVQPIIIRLSTDG